MFGILDRYITRELILPFLLGLVVFTFLLMIQPLGDYSEQLIAKGVSWGIVVRVLGTLVPQALAVTIPMALLIGLLIGLGRLSADRETVAMQACGISIYRLLRPVLLLAVDDVGRDVVHHDRGRPDGQSDVSRDRLRHHLGARGKRDQAARLLRGLSQPRSLRRRRPGRRRVARVLPGRHLQARSANRVHRRDLPAGDRSRQAHRGHGPHQGRRATRRRCRIRPNTRSRALPS